MKHRAFRGSERILVGCPTDSFLPENARVLLSSFCNPADFGGKQIARLREVFMRSWKRKNVSEMIHGPLREIVRTMITE